VGMRENGRVLVAAQKYSLDGWSIVGSGQFVRIKLIKL